MRFINELAVKITYVLISCIVLVIMWEVIARSVFNSPTSWYLEVASLLGACSATLAAAYVLQQEAHLGVDFIIDRLSPKWHNRMLVITSVFGALVTLVIIVMLALETQWSIKLHRVTDNASLPLFPFQILANLGLLLLAVQFVIRARKYYLKMKETS